jgi:CBS domain-containing protein
MIVAEMMDRGAPVIESGATLEEAAAMMRGAGAGFLAVSDGTACVGVISDLDIAIRAVCACVDPAGATVGDVVSGDLAWCEEAHTVEEAVARMLRWRMEDMLVVDHAGRPAGTVSLRRLLPHVADAKLAARVNRALSTPKEWPGRTPH